jgi:hypothetical protein
VLHPSEVAARIGGQSGERAAPRVVFPNHSSPLFQGEGRIGDDAVGGLPGCRAGYWQPPIGVIRGSLHRSFW